MPHVPGSARDDHWMRRALRLARSRAGGTWPNPTVGACIVRDDRLLAEAAHEAAGEAHAEAAAIAALVERGEDARGATLYVTLEPCHHQGRTPPCTRAIQAAGIARVVYAVADTSPRRHDGGAAWLTEQGVQVDVIGSSRLRHVAWEMNHPFFETRDDDEAHVTLKLALSLDGGMAPRRGRIVDPENRRVTGFIAQRRVHRMRAGARAILVGRVTAEDDRPRLDTRLLPAYARPREEPRPVVLDPRGSLTEDLLPPRALVFVAEGKAAARRTGEGAREWVAVPAREPGRLDWPAVFAALVVRRLGCVLVEAGPTLAADLLATSRPHRIHLFLAPRVFGPPAPRLPVLARLDAEYRTWSVRRAGEDVEWILRRRDLPDAPAGHREFAG